MAQMFGLRILFVRLKLLVSHYFSDIQKFDSFS